MSACLKCQSPKVTCALQTFTSNSLTFRSALALLIGKALAATEIKMSQKERKRERKKKERKKEGKKDVIEVFAGLETCMM